MWPKFFFDIFQFPEPICMSITHITVKINYYLCTLDIPLYKSWLYVSKYIIQTEYRYESSFVFALGGEVKGENQAIENLPKTA